MARVSGVLLTLASLVVIIAGLRAAAPILLPFLCSLFLAIVTLPLSECRRVRPALAILGAVAVNLLVLAIILSLVAGSFRDFTLAAPRYQAGLAEMASAMLAWLQARGVDTSQCSLENSVDGRWIAILLEPPPDVPSRRV